MGCLTLLLLLGVPHVWGSSEVPTAPKNFTLRFLQISSFANSSWTRTDCSMWLGELQTHSWNNDSDAFSFLLPWSHGNFSEQQWEKLHHLFQVYRISFKRDVQELVKMVHGAYPIELQISAGCEVHAGNGSESFFHVAWQGIDILSFQGTSWEPAPEAPPWVQVVSKVLNLDQGTKEMVQWLLNDTCPQFVRGLVEAGKSELEKQEKPEAWLSYGPSPGPGHLLLVCHVSGFYPKPVWVMWMQREEQQPGSQRGDVLPNADGTWYVRVTLDVVAEEAAGLSCRVKHSSLGGKDIILYWDRSHVSLGWIILAVLVLLLLIAGFILWFMRHRSYKSIL
ncbi:antigen-presenting glycoprotein CD1d [Orycteropus afer afer]|uniref:Antigen-presenting glycoprotein CD1d n=1 Tax=Orycteropus afer afer TaxID=1230840 RepID=A0A8B7AD84_ORYAF|nr:antigen-presenting glycoprotein CD1d [Orycteropus afer afer]